MHHFVTEMCTHVHISVTMWCTVGYSTDALSDMWIGSVRVCFIKHAPGFVAFCFVILILPVHLVIWSIYPQYSGLLHCMIVTLPEKYPWRLWGVGPVRKKQHNKNCVHNSCPKMCIYPLISRSMSGLLGCMFGLTVNKTSQLLIAAHLFVQAISWSVVSAQNVSYMWKRGILKHGEFAWTISLFLWNPLPLNNFSAQMHNY